MLKRLFDISRREVKRISKIADAIIGLENEYKALSDDELQAKTEEFKNRYNNGESLDDLLVEAYATVREASTRVLGMTPFRVQLMGATTIHEGNIAEMKTGEGKTLTSVMPAYLNALTGDGVHIVTVNEYLAAREAEGEIGELFKWLGLTVGLNLRALSKPEKKEAYLNDILYSTNNELGFDYLRDHMVVHKHEMVQRPLNYAIIDEIDSILIDEARTPLIISGGAKSVTSTYKQADMFCRRLTEEDYDIDIKTRVVNLEASGIEKAEEYFKVENLYDIESVSLLHSINNAIKANFIFEKDVDYVVQDNKVVIVDSHTGRLMHGRQYSEGLHQALEAKENVEIKKETTTLANITFQNFFRMYSKLSGMTGTAKTEEEEFRNIYNMLVVEIPTNKPIVRDDANDLIFASMNAKYKAIAEEIKVRHSKGQPILVGTISIETSEYLSKLLKKRGVKHNLLNAKQHEREADIVENAGQKYAVTIATNMAGRGTDIKLGDGVVELGGLAVIGTERHESRRIDNQLRGRSGRQGDPGYSRFFLSAEDDLLRRFGGESFKKRIEQLTSMQGGPSEDPLEYGFFSRMVERAQSQIEGNNFDRRKTVLQYDEVLRKQREVIYAQRREVLFSDDIDEAVYGIIERHISVLLHNHLDESGDVLVDEVFKQLNGYYLPLGALDINMLRQPFDAVIEYITKVAINVMKEKERHIGSEKYIEFLKVVMLRVVDTYWIQHIDQMYELRQGIGLQSYAQKNPLREYQEVGFSLFTDMIAAIDKDVSKRVLRAQIRDNIQRVQVAKPTSTSSGKDELERKPRKVVKVGRNDECPCGSGKKYKKCCGK